MKKYFFLVIVLASISSCKDESKTTVPDEKELEQPALTAAEKLAHQAGLKSWDNVQEINFTFNVAKDNKIVMSRIWKWNPNTDAVQLNALEDTIIYNRKTVLNEKQMSTDRAFINDVYWLLPELKLIWDSGTTITEKKSQLAPISKDTLNSITILYGEEGGYTPGDAYDIYYDKNHQFKEWIFRKGNDTTATMMTTFENFKTYNGITIATDHRSPDGFTNINFTDIEVIKKK